MIGERMAPEVLRSEPQFRLLFTGQVLSLLGDRMMLVALPFAVLRSGGTTGAVGLVVAAQFVPFVVFGLIGGALSDRSDRRQILVRSDAARMAVQACAGALLLAHAATPPLLGVLVLLYGTAEAFFRPAFTRLLPRPSRTPGSSSPRTPSAGSHSRSRRSPVRRSLGCSSPARDPARRFCSIRRRSR